MTAEQGGAELVPVSQGPVFPDALPLLLLSKQVIFPMSVVPVRISDAKDERLVDDVDADHKLVAVLTIRDLDVENPGLENAYEIGCLCRILQVQHLPDGTRSAAIQAMKRFRVMGLVKREPYLVVRVHPLEEPTPDLEALAPLTTTVKGLMARLIALSPNIPEEASAVIEGIGAWLR